MPDTIALEGELENAIVERLKPVLGLATVEALPDKQWNFTNPKGAALVMFIGSSSTSVRNTGVMVQEVKLSYEVLLLARSLRESTGLYQMLYKTRRSLLGWIPEQTGQPLRLDNIRNRGYEDTAWRMSLNFSTDALLIADAEPETGPPLIQLGVELCAKIS